MDSMVLKSLNHADEIRDLPKTHIEVVNFNELSVMRVIFQPGWKWSECVRPTVGTDSCLAPHINYVISGRLMIAMDDGSNQEMKAGDVAIIPPGHDAWVIGDEPFVAIDFTAGKMFGKV